jgi:c-di-AMP phosphodiesterase-like protein
VIGAMALLRYTLLRVLLFLVVAALLWIAGMRGFWLLLVAIFVSGVVSVFVLSRSRDAASASVANRVSQVRQRMNERTAAEDAWDEQHRAGSDGRQPNTGPGDD